MDEIRIPLAGEHYDHYQGGRFEVLAVGRLSDRRDELMVVYRAQGEGVLIIPLGRWCELVEVLDAPALVFPDEQASPSRRTPRFALCPDSPPAAEVVPLSPEEIEELDRELALELVSDVEHQRCRHIRTKAGARDCTLRLATTNAVDKSSSKFRAQVDLCAFCAGYVLGHMKETLKSEPLCASS